MGLAGLAQCSTDVDGAIDVDMMSHVVPNEVERAVPQVSDVLDAAGQEIVDTDDAVAAIEQRLAEMRIR